MTTTAKDTQVTPDKPTDSLVALVEQSPALRESPLSALRAKQLRLLRILGERGNQPLPATPK